MLIIVNIYYGYLLLFALSLLFVLLVIIYVLPYIQMGYNYVSREFFAADRYDTGKENTYDYAPLESPPLSGSNIPRNGAIPDNYNFQNENIYDLQSDAGHVSELNVAENSGAADNKYMTTRAIVSHVYVPARGLYRTIAFRNCLYDSRIGRWLESRVTLDVLSYKYPNFYLIVYRNNLDYSVWIDILHYNDIGYGCKNSLVTLVKSGVLSDVIYNRFYGKAIDVRNNNFSLSP